MGYTDQLHLSAACKHLRGISAPFIFKTVTIPVDGVGNIASLALLTLKNYGHFTKELKLLMRTGPPSLTSLAIFNFPPPLESTVFSTGLWTRFLNGIQDLHISLYGEGGTRRAAVRRIRTGSFLAQLGDVFFKHLPSLKRLQIEASERAPLDADDTSSEDDEFPFGLGEMPVMEHLELENIVAGGRMARFLQSGLTAGPYSLSLVNITAKFEGDTHAEFFNSLVDARVPIASFTASFNE